jgi:hypothetical protein
VDDCATIRERSVASLEADRAAIPQKRDEVLHALLARDYEVPRAREFAAHGVSRQLKTMMHCIECDFVILPPNREAHPSMDELTHAVVYIQAFIFNAFQRTKSSGLVDPGSHVLSAVHRGLRS